MSRSYREDARRSLRNPDGFRDEVAELDHRIEAPAILRPLATALQTLGGAR